MSDAISRVRVSACTLPLANPISDAKVLTGRQKPMTEIAILFVEIKTRDGAEGVGFSYSKRAGGPGQFAHAKEIAPVLVGEDPNDIAKLWDKLCWAGASVGRSGRTSNGQRVEYKVENEDVLPGFGYGVTSFENLGNPMKRRTAPSSENGRGAKTPWGGG